MLKEKYKEITLIISVISLLTIFLNAIDFNAYVKTYISGLSVVFGKDGYTFNVVLFVTWLLPILAVVAIYLLKGDLGFYLGIFIFLIASILELFTTQIFLSANNLEAVGSLFNLGIGPTIRGILSFIGAIYLLSVKMLKNNN